VREGASCNTARGFPAEVALVVERGHAQPVPSNKRRVRPRACCHEGVGGGVHGHSSQGIIQGAYPSSRWRRSQPSGWTWWRAAAPPRADPRAWSRRDREQRTFLRGAWGVVTRGVRAIIRVICLPTHTRDVAVTSSRRTAWVISMPCTVNAHRPRLHRRYTPTVSQASVVWGPTAPSSDAVGVSARRIRHMAQQIPDEHYRVRAHPIGSCTLDQRMACRPQATRQMPL
jgi:hypothetical protein